MQLRGDVTLKLDPDAAVAPAPATGEWSLRRPVRGPLPAHLPRQLVVLPSPSACSCCGGRPSKLGEDFTETLEVVPRQWKVVQTVCEPRSHPGADGLH